MRTPMRYAQGTASTSGNNTVIAAPSGAGERIAIVGLHIQNASASETTVILKFGSDSILPLVLPAKGDGEVRDFQHPWTAPAETAVILNLSGANDTLYSFAYWVEEIGS